MTIQYFRTILLLLLVTILTAGCVNDIPETVEVTEEMVLTAENNVPEMQSAGVMAFGENDALLVADYQTGTIFAFEVNRGRGPIAFSPYNITDVDRQIATLLGTTVDQININDMVAHPVNRKAYLSVMVGQKDTAQPAIFTVDREGLIEWVDLANVPYTSITIEDLPDEDIVFGNNIAARTLSITDIDYYNGEIFVSGLSNAAFSSVVRRIPYPFDGTISYASTEIYHTSNDQIESHAPIRSQTIIEAESGPFLLAAYAGTPLVALPLTDLQDGAHVQGKTIAELGYGSTPIDVLSLSESGADKVLVSSTGYNVMTFEVDQVLAANSTGGLTSPVDPGTIEGVDPYNSALSGVSQISDLDSVHVLMLRRNRISGNLDLVSTIKGVYFRLSDFQSEYDSVGYEYPSAQQFTKYFQNLLRLNEGHREEVILP